MQRGPDNMPGPGAYLKTDSHISSFGDQVRKTHIVSFIACMVFYLSWLYEFDQMACASNREW
jgi:hypothetical protein